MKKSKIFARKIISVILAVLMAASTFTGVLTAYAKSTDDNHDSKLAANFMAWAETTDNQTAEALLDWVDGILADPAPAVHVERYGESNIDYAIYCWCSEADYWSVYYGLTESLQGVFAEAKVEFSYQHLNVHIVDK